MNLAEIRDALVFGRKNGGGRKAMFIESADTTKWDEIRTSESFAEDRRDLLAAAEKYRKVQIDTLPYSLYKIYDETGSRFEYENVYFDRRGRLNTFAAMALLFNEKSDLGALEDILWAICDEYTWCLPAHLGGNSTKVPEEKDNTKVIDLFSAETGFALAEILHLLEGRLSPIVVYRASGEIKKRVLESYGSGSVSSWETRNNNWAGVCAGSVGAAALYLIDDDDTLAPLIYRLIGTMDLYLGGFRNDGATAEGIGYWEYGFGFITYFSGLLYQRTGGKIDLLLGEKIRKIASFPQKCYLNGNNVASFGDCSRTHRYNPGLFQYLKTRFNDIETPNKMYQCRLYDDNCNRWCHYIRNLVWKGAAQGNLSETAYFLKDVQWMTSRKSTGNCAAAFAAKGGDNAESHNHNDLGSFLFDVNGEVLLVDLGSGEYTKQYFGNDRYTIFSCGSQGHSVPIIEGGYQQAGAQCKAKVISKELTPNRDLLKLDLSKAYQDGNLRSFIRSFSFEKKVEQALILTDAFEFGRKPSSITERFITLQRPGKIADNTVRLNGSKGRVDILFDPGTAICSFYYTELTSHRTNAQIVYIVDFVIKTDSPILKAEFRILPAEKSAGDAD